MQPQVRLDFNLDIPDSFGYWFAGFVDGEGCFFASWKYKAWRERKYKHLLTGFSLNLRDDDSQIIYMIQEMLGGIGKIHTNKHHKPDSRGYISNPSIDYKVIAISDQRNIIVPLFEKYPLRTNKGFDFDIWKEIVEIRYQNKNQSLSKNTVDYLQPLCSNLSESKKYNPRLVLKKDI